VKEKLEILKNDLGLVACDEEIGYLKEFIDSISIEDLKAHFKDRAEIIKKNREDIVHNSQSNLREYNNKDYVERLRYEELIRILIKYMQILKDDELKSYLNDNFEVQFKDWLCSYLLEVQWRRKKGSTKTSV